DWIIGCGPLVLRFGMGARSQVPKTSFRWRTAVDCGVGDEPTGPLTFRVRPSGSSRISKKHIYGSCRDREPTTRIFVPGLKICGVIPMRLSCVVPCDSHTYSRVRPFSST